MAGRLPRSEQSPEGRRCHFQAVPLPASCLSGGFLRKHQDLWSSLPSLLPEAPGDRARDILASQTQQSTSLGTQPALRVSQSQAMSLLRWAQTWGSLMEEQDGLEGHSGEMPPWNTPKVMLGGPRGRVPDVPQD